MSNSIAPSRARAEAAQFGQAAPQQSVEYWRNPALFWVLMAATAGLMYITAQDAIHYMVHHWVHKEEYSHAMFLPLIAAFLIWQKSNPLAQTPFDGAWSGFALLLAGALFMLVGIMSTLYVIQQYALIVMIAGIALSYSGTKAFKYFIVPIIILVLTIPLPHFFYNNLSSQLQLISSQLGVAVIRTFGIPVFLEGNVIDLGQMKLQVVEACAGLRYLFPLLSLGFVVANFFSVPLWMRITTIVSTIPITVLMNSARIGLIGVSVEYWGTEMAEGVLHDFEGWVVFMASLAVLLAEMSLLAKISNSRARLNDVFVVELPEKIPSAAQVSTRRLPASLLVSLALVPVVAMAGQTLNKRQEIIPDHKPLSRFPLQIDRWSGQHHAMDSNVLDVLKVSDHFQIDYHSPGNEFINFYVAFYASQRAGESAHSPRSCIPGGGWRIVSMDTHTLSVNDRSGQPLTVQRLLIQKGETSQLVYYWFDQRGRVLTNEFLVKWYLLRDALVKNRSDGSLVRVSTMIPAIDAESIARADRTLEQFLAHAEPQLQQYLPQ